MNYGKKLKKIISSQYVFSGIRITLAVVIPSIILAYFGLLKEYFIFPLGTSFAGLTDMTGPFIRRRNALIASIFSFTFVTAVACLVKDYPILIYLEIGIFTLFFSMLGVYGQRMAAVGGLTLVVFSIFVNGPLNPDANIFKVIGLVFAGSLWFLVVFLILMKLQPYRLPSQIIGENYLELSKYLKLRAQFYLPQMEQDKVLKKVIAQQVIIKNLQEESREVIFKTRTIINESTTQSRLLMILFLNSIDLYEELFTSNNDYSKLHKKFKNQGILDEINRYLISLANEIEHIGVALQTGTKPKPIININRELENLYSHYFQLRKEKISAENLEDLMTLRIILTRIKDTSDRLNTIYKYFHQDIKMMKSISTGLDIEKFAPKQEKLNTKVFLQNFSLKSAIFRHAIRMTFAMVLGYGISQFNFLGIGHAYWILITIVAIMRPAYSVTKHRNILRIYGTFFGAILAYLILIYIQDPVILLTIICISMISCFTLMKGNYAWSVFFMTIYIFVTFNYLQPNSVNDLFKDRILDTLVAGFVIFIASYFVLPVWEKEIIWNLMKKSADANKEYLSIVIKTHQEGEYSLLDYKLRRKDAIISLANLSDSFQRMLSNPQKNKKDLQLIHPFVTTSHLITAYIASLSQYYKDDKKYAEIDFNYWQTKILNELELTIDLLDKKMEIKTDNTPNIEQKNKVSELLEKRKSEIEDDQFLDLRDINKPTYLTELKNLQELLELMYNVAYDQRKLTENYFKNN